MKTKVLRISCYEQLHNITLAPEYNVINEPMIAVQFGPKKENLGWIITKEACCAIFHSSHNTTSCGECNSPGANLDL